MTIDHIAGAMTNGRPRADFTARVMAPIYGRPRPGFTARVVAQAFRPADAPAAHAFSPGFRQALILIPVAVALIAGVMAVRAARVDLPAMPVAPRLATAPVFSPAIEAPPLVAQAFRPATRQAQTLEPAKEPAEALELSLIYMIAALEGPADIAMKSIEPAAFTIPALDAPAPLKVADLKNFKEEP